MLPEPGPSQRVTSKPIRLARKLWRVIDITREYVPQFQAHVILEAPDRERLTLTFRDESAQTLVRSDVIALAPKTGIPPDIPDTVLGDYLLPTPVRLGKTRWWKEWVKQEGKEIKRDWRLFLEQKRGEEIKILVRRSSLKQERLTYAPPV